MSTMTQCLRLVKDETATLNLFGHIGIEVEHATQIYINGILYCIGYPTDDLKLDNEYSVRTSSNIIEFGSGRVSTIRSTEPINIIVTYKEEG